MKRTFDIAILFALAAFGVVLGLRLAPAGTAVRADPPAPTATTQFPAGTNYKLVRCGPQTRMDAVVVTKVTVAGQEVQCGLTLGPKDTQPVTPFQAGNDWLKQMDVYLFNRTNKMIVWVDVPLGFPETGSGRTRAEPQCIYSMLLGRTPAVDAFSHRTGKPFAVAVQLRQIAFAPGQTLVLHVADYFDKIRDYVEQHMLLSGITKVVVHMGTFYFADGMRWQAGGGFSVPDPDHPGGFRHLGIGHFFPGRPSHNWPPRPSSSLAGPQPAGQGRSVHIHNAGRAGM